RLHPADVVAHDEEDVGLLLLLRACRRHGGERRKEAEAQVPAHTHDLFPQFWLPEPGRQPAPGDSPAERSARRHATVIPSRDSEAPAPVRWAAGSSTLFELSVRTAEPTHASCTEDAMVEQSQVREGLCEIRFALSLICLPSRAARL